MYHFFLSHDQATGGDQWDSLAMELDNGGYTAWYGDKRNSLCKADWEIDAQVNCRVYLLPLGGRSPTGVRSLRGAAGGGRTSRRVASSGTHC